MKINPDRASGRLLITIAALLLTAVGGAHAAWLHGHQVGWNPQQTLERTPEVQWYSPGNSEESNPLFEIEHLGDVTRESFQNIQSGEALVASGLHSGFRLRIPADTQEWVVRVYLSMNSGRALIQGNVSGGGAHQYADITFASRNQPAFRCYTFNYSAARDGEELILDMTIMHAGKTKPQLAMHAVALSQPKSNRAPRIRILTPNLTPTLRRRPISQLKRRSKTMGMPHASCFLIVRRRSDSVKPPRRRIEFPLIGRRSGADRSVPTSTMNTAVGIPPSPCATP